MRAFLVGLSMLALACGAPAPEPSGPATAAGDRPVAAEHTIGASTTAGSVVETGAVVADAGSGTRITHAETEEECRRCNGRWGPRGITGIPGCVCPTGDGGKPCRSPRDCEHRCEIEWERAVALGQVLCDPSGHCSVGEQLPEGRCAADYDIFGCRAWIVEQQTASGVQLTVRQICVD